MVKCIPLDVGGGWLDGAKGGIERVTLVGYGSSMFHAYLKLYIFCTMSLCIRLLFMMTFVVTIEINTVFSSIV